MQNDNASNEVIQVTNNDNMCYGRLYFRPLTPTQFNNEGYKPIQVRNSEINASCPVPIFFCFNADATLNYPGTEFAERGLAGHRHNIKSGLKEFEKLNFSKIYHVGSYSKQDYDIKEYRLSEVIHENGFPIAQLLSCIICRSTAEREMLLFLLGQYSMRLYNTYKENGAVLMHTSGDGLFDYFTVENCRMELKDVNNCDIVRIRVAIDGIEMYINDINVEEEMLL